MARLACAVAMAACAFENPELSNTAFRCTESVACPDGFACKEGVCRRQQDDDADAPITRADAGAVDGASVDPMGSVDAAFDAVPSGDGVRTLTFGERSSADVRNVTTDTWISDHFPNQVHGSDAELRVEATPLTAALIQFDLRAIPVGATIESATITWTVFDAVSASETASAQVLAVPWSEATASWFQASAGAPWPAEGAQGAAVNAAKVVDGFSPRSVGAFTLALPAAVVQGWIDDPATNHGLRWQTTGIDLLQVRAREASDAERPLLSVTFRSPP